MADLLQQTAQNSSPGAGQPQPKEELDLATPRPKLKIRLNKKTNGNPMMNKDNLNNEPKRKIDGQSKDQARMRMPFPFKLNL